MSNELDLTQMMEMAETFGLLSDPTRLSIVLACSENPISAGDIAEKLGLSAPLVSHHLRLLRNSKMVTSERRGKYVFYTLADDCVRSILKTMTHHLFEHGHENSTPNINGAA